MSSTGHGNAGKLVVLTGPSGVGKSSVAKKLAEKPEFALSISATTRPCRSGEREGVNYYFISKEDFNEKLNEKAFLEHAKVYDHFYGTLKAKVQGELGKGTTLVLDVDVQGGLAVKRSPYPALLFFLLPPSLEELERRLRLRKRESEEEIQKRLALAKHEMTFKDRYHFQVVNDVLEETVEAIFRIILDNQVPQESSSK